MTYRDEYRRSIEEREAFWRDKAAALDWFRAPSQILGQDSEGHYRWFADGELNTAHLALDFHVNNGRAGQTAIIYDSPVTGTVEHISYRDLRDRVAHLAGALAQLGVRKGDCVVPSTIDDPAILAEIAAVFAARRKSGSE